MVSDEKDNSEPNCDACRIGPLDEDTAQVVMQFCYNKPQVPLLLPELKAICHLRNENLNGFSNGWAPGFVDPFGECGVECGIPNRRMDMPDPLRPLRVYCTKCNARWNNNESYITINDMTAQAAQMDSECAVRASGWVSPNSSQSARFEVVDCNNHLPNDNGIQIGIAKRGFEFGNHRGMCEYGGGSKTSYAFLDQRGAIFKKTRSLYSFNFEAVNETDARVAMVKGDIITITIENRRISFFRTNGTVRMQLFGDSVQIPEWFSDDEEISS